LDSNVRAKLKAELPGIHARLLAHALFLVGRSGWRRLARVDQTEAAKDLLQEAVLRTLQGSRRWDPERVDLARFLREAMRSIANAAVRSPQNSTVRLDNYEEQSASEHVLTDDSESKEATFGRSQEIGQQVAAVIDAAGKDEFLCKVVEAIMDGDDKAGAISKRLAVRVEDVYNALRKLRRRVDAARNPGDRT
jgi:DNA-directed RNA polymerase specialized sigma24 family protein